MYGVGGGGVCVCGRPGIGVEGYVFYSDNLHYCIYFYFYFWGVGGVGGYPVSLFIIILNAFDVARFVNHSN